MDTHEIRRQTTETLTSVLTHLAEAGIRTPDATGDTYAKWDRADGGYVIFRANYRGAFGTLDFRWVDDEDGKLNGPFAPITFDYLPWLARDVDAVLGVLNPTRDETREMVQRMGKATRPAVS